jgi:hypothetical protein
MYHRVVDLDVDIGADAVDYKCVYYIFLVRSFEWLTLFLPTSNKLLPAHSSHDRHPSHYTTLPLPAVTHPQPFSSAIAAKESLSGLETEMRKLEELVKEVQDEMDYLKKREMRFQSTNGKSRPFSRSPLLPAPLVAAFAWCDPYGGVTRPILTPSPLPCVESTNVRVQNFALFTFVTLVCLGTWQIFHLRSFFRKKYLID